MDILDQVLSQHPGSRCARRSTSPVGVPELVGSIEVDSKDLEILLSGVRTRVRRHSDVLLERFRVRLV